MSSDLPAIQARHLGKRYTLFDRPADRLKSLLWGPRGSGGREFWALRDVDFEIARGEVVGVVGRNGAGKSTLLQMVCGTLTPTEGELEVRGRVSALLELGAGFNPEFSGVENVFLNGALMGLSRTQLETRLDGILAFADIGAFAHQPVKTYSTGMFMRLAFAVATSVDPAILVIDEALSVGDGAFARRSFDRIMSLKDGGATILFCSHALYHVQALCSRAMWLDAGRLRMLATAPRVAAAYDATLSAAGVTDKPLGTEATAPAVPLAPRPAQADGEQPAPSAPAGTARIRGIEWRMEGQGADLLEGHAGVSSLEIRVRYASDPALPCPSLAVGIEHASGTVVSSAGSVDDGVTLNRDAMGNGTAVLRFEALPLLKGEYHLSVILACERGLHVYEVASRAATFRMTQTGLAQGLVRLPHRWETGGDDN